MVLNKKVLDYIEWDSIPFEKAPLENIAKDWELMAYKHYGFWSPMDTIKQKNDLNELWNKWDAKRKVW